MNDLVNGKVNICRRSFLLNPNIDIRNVVNNPIPANDRYYLNYNLNLMPDHIPLPPQHYWIENALFRHPNFTIDDVLAIWPQYKFPRRGHGDYISRNPNLTMQDIKKFKRFDFGPVSRYANITMDDVHANPCFSWSMKGLNANAHITDPADYCGDNPNNDPHFIPPRKPRRKQTRSQIIHALLANRFIWHSEKVYEHVAARITMRRNRFVEDIGQLFGRDLAGVIARYIVAV